MNARRTLSGPRGLVAVGAVAALLLTGCGGGDDGEQQAGGDARNGGGGEPAAAEQADLTSIGLVNQPEEVGEPVPGGTLEFGVYSETRSLNPATASGHGVAGGTELAAIYDALVRYNPETHKYEPQLAKSLEPNDDFSVWTMKLREGVTFSDGTPFDAEAVAWSLNYYLENGGTLAPVVKDTIADTETPDAHTLVFTLTEPWSQFPFLFADSPGNILAPTSVDGEEFTPIGAGAFALTRFAPGEELVLTAREDYWDGPPRLDKLRFVPLQGAQAKLDSLRSGGLDVGFLRDEATILTALEDGRPGFLNVFNAGGVNLINNGVRGQTDRIGANPKIRKAIAYATDTDVVSQRTAEGKGLFGKKLFQEWSRWTTEAEPPPYDPEKARELLNEVKQKTGYDGSITYTCYSSSAGEARALVMQQLLNKVGFDMKLVLVPNVGAQIQKVFIKADYDMACWGFNISDAAPWVKLSTNLHSGSAQNILGYNDPQMDTLLHELKVAQSDETRGEILNEIQQLWTETVPAVIDSATPEMLAWTEDVHGIVPTESTIALLHDAWIE